MSWLAGIPLVGRFFGGEEAPAAAANAGAAGAAVNAGAAAPAANAGAAAPAANAGAAGGAGAAAVGHNMVASHLNAPAAGAGAGAAGGAGAAAANAGAAAYGNGNNGKKYNANVLRAAGESFGKFNERQMKVKAARKVREEAEAKESRRIEYLKEKPRGVQYLDYMSSIGARDIRDPWPLGTGGTVSSESIYKPSDYKNAGLIPSGGSRKSKKSLKRENRKVGGSYNNGNDIGEEVDKLAGEGIVAYSVRKPKVIEARKARIEGQKTRNARSARDAAAHRTAVEIAESRALGFGTGPGAFATKNIYDQLRDMNPVARRAQITSLLSAGHITKEELEKRHIAYGGSRKTRRVVKRKQSKSRKNKK